MLKISQKELRRMGKKSPGLIDDITYFEQMDIPPCPRCKSANTASVQVGVISRTMSIACATTKFKLIMNGSPGKYFCNDCERYFGPKSAKGKQPGLGGFMLGKKPGESWEGFKSRVVHTLQEKGLVKSDEGGGGNPRRRTGTEGLVAELKAKVKSR